MRIAYIAISYFVFMLMFTSAQHGKEKDVSTNIPWIGVPDVAFWIGKNIILFSF